MPRRRSLGVTQFQPEGDRRNVPRTYLLERLAVALGEITTGAENDLKEATQLARRMVSEFGMGEQTGPVVYDLSDGSPYLSQRWKASRACIQRRRQAAWMPRSSG